MRIESRNKRGGSTGMWRHEPILCIWMKPCKEEESITCLGMDMQLLGSSSVAARCQNHPSQPIDMRCYAMICAILQKSMSCCLGQVLRSCPRTCATRAHDEGALLQGPPPRTTSSYVVSWCRTRLASVRMKAPQLLWHEFLFQVFTVPSLWLFICIEVHWVCLPASFEVSMIFRYFVVYVL